MNILSGKWKWNQEEEKIAKKIQLIHRSECSLNWKIWSERILPKKKFFLKKKLMLEYRFDRILLAMKIESKWQNDDTQSIHSSKWPLVPLSLVVRYSLFVSLKARLLVLLRTKIILPLIFVHLQHPLCSKSSNKFSYSIRIVCWWKVTDL